MNLNQGTPVAFGLGGNLGQPEQTFCQALEMLEDQGVCNLRMASCYKTDPVGCYPGTPMFTNSAATGVWAGTPLELLALTQRIECALGRPEIHDSRSSRPMDIDILLFGDRILTTERLILPHPRMFQRAFVLEPLSEIAGDWLNPLTGKTILEEWNTLKDRSERGLH